MSRSRQRLITDIKNIVFKERNKIPSYKHTPLPNESQIKLVLMGMAKIQGKSFPEYMDDLDEQVPNVSTENAP